KEAVGWLDVAVDYAVAMGFVQAIENVQDLGDGLSRRQRPALADLVRQRPPRHKLHDDVGPAAILVGGQYEHAARMGNGAGEATLATETLEGINRPGLAAAD